LEAVSGFPKIKTISIPNQQNTESIENVLQNLGLVERLWVPASPASNQFQQRQNLVLFLEFLKTRIRGYFAMILLCWSRKWAKTAIRMRADEHHRNPLHGGILAADSADPCSSMFPLFYTWNHVEIRTLDEAQLNCPRC
jgi:hypothetical protein